MDSLVVGSAVALGAAERSGVCYASNGVVVYASGSVLVVQDVDGGAQVRPRAEVFESLCLRGRCCSMHACVCMCIRAHACMLVSHGPRWCCGVSMQHACFGHSVPPCRGIVGASCRDDDTPILRPPGSVQTQSNARRAPSAAPSQFLNVEWINDAMYNFATPSSRLGKLPCKTLQNAFHELACPADANDCDRQQAGC
eukprot:353126-Chlamydomonas_euryale.AAC.3